VKTETQVNTSKNTKNYRRSVTGYLLILVGIAVSSAVNAQLASHVRSKSDLEYGPVLYEFYQGQYFYGLIEDSFALAAGNKIAHTPQAKLLSGSMMLRFGMPDSAAGIFNALLDTNSSTEVKNRAWYHLARLYFNKSDINSARQAINKIKGEVPKDIHIDYHYLASLVDHDGRHVEMVEEGIASLSNRLPQYSYLLFNMAVTQLRSGDVMEAVGKLEEIAAYNGTDRELLLLGDRARHGLAQLATQAQDLPRAWQYLTGIRTTGLYSNRGLLSYAWTAIKMKMYNEAIPALQLLDQRSIAIPEVQEAKVLLAHLYEQEGAPRKALKSNLLAEKAFKEGLQTLDQARKIIARRDVPREFIENIEAIMDESDWYASHASVDYKKLTPFLIDLMASHPFNETLKDLAALYVLEDNLSYWLSQTSEHKLILKNAQNKNVKNELDQLLKRSDMISEKLLDQKTEIHLTTLTLEPDEKQKLNVLIESAEHDLKILEDKIYQLKKIKQPYVQPADYVALVNRNHTRINEQLSKTRQLISKLEPVMRKLVESELSNHEQRMRYYWAQSRLAKARLFDSTLLSLEKARPSSVDAKTEAGEKKNEK